MILRPYQSAAVDRALDLIDQRPCLVAPTGSGKTVMACEVIRRFPGTVLFLAHRKELIHQARERLLSHGVESGIILAGHRADPSQRVQVGSVQTAGRRELRPYDLTIVDECQHSVSTSYAPFLSGRVLGLTATPFRAGGQGLGDVFKTIVVAAHPDELLDAGTLVRPRMFAASLPDLSGVRVTAGDYNANALSDRLRKSTLTGDIVAHWLRYAAGTKTMVYAVDVAHSESIVAAFRASGVRAEHVDGQTPNRHEVVERLVRGEIDLVSNCSVYTEGTDIPELETLVIARPTKSLGLHIQIIGRVLRTAPGKTGALILDHAGNLVRHGPISQRLEYSLDSPVKRSTTGGSPLGLRRCPSCYGLSPSGTPQCPECGHLFTSDRTPKTRAGELTEFDDLDRRALWWQLALADCVAGRLVTEAITEYRERYGRWPNPREGGIFTDTPLPTSNLRTRAFRWLCVFAHRAGKKEHWVDSRYRECFGANYQGGGGDVNVRNEMREKYGWEKKHFDVEFRVVDGKVVARAKYAGSE